MAGVALGIWLLIALAPFFLWILFEARNHYIQSERERNHPDKKK